MSADAKQLAVDITKDKFTNKNDVKNSIMALSPAEKQMLLDQLTTVQVVSGGITAGWAIASFMLSKKWKKGAGWKAGTVVTGIFAGTGLFSQYAIIETRKALKA